MRMSAIDKLINYILGLTPEQAVELATVIDSLTDNHKKIIIELLKDCNDVDLLDLIFRILCKHCS